MLGILGLIAVGLVITLGFGSATLSLVERWSGSIKGDPMSCKDALQSPNNPPDFLAAARAHLGQQKTPDLRLDGSHLSSSQEQGELGLLRGRRD